jgi:type IV pilus assembly protein PilQ
MERLRMSKKLGMWVVMLALLAASAVAVAQPAGETPEEAKPPSALEERMQKKISVDFRDTPIDDVLRIIAKQADTDIVKSPEVTGNVTATLTEVPLEEALHHILAAHGYAYIASENMMTIVPASEVTEALENLVSRVYQITYADVKTVEAALQKFLSPRGTISSNPGTSHIIITDIESKVKAIDVFVTEIDRITPQVVVEARIYDLTSKDGLEVGFEWLLGRNTTYGTAGPGDLTTSPTGLTDPFTTGSLNSGISTTETTGLLRFGILDDSVNLDVLFTANQEKVCAQLLASPRVLVLDHEEATFKIIEEVPFQELTQTAGGGNIGSTQFKEVGVELIVTPHVARDGLIRLELNPKFSVQTDTVSIVIPVPGSLPIESPQPVVANRETITTVLVENEQTVVLGGLRKKGVTTQVSKIPLLGDMPILGAFFRFEGEEVIVNELLVFVTPRIVEDLALSDHEAKRFKDTDIECADCPTPKTNTRQM